MRKFPLLILYLAICLSCNDKNTSENNSKRDIFCNIKELKLPLRFNSNQEIDLTSYSIADDSLLSTISSSETGFSLFGKITVNNKIILLVGMIPNDQGSPMFITVDTIGKKIDSFLGYKTAGADMGWYCSNSVILKQGGKIEFIDSTLTREIKEDGTNEIPGTDRLKVIKKVYQIDNEGLFVESSTPNIR